LSRPRETERLCGLLKLRLGSRGFLMEDNPQFLRVRSNRRGSSCRRCRFPQEVSESSPRRALLPGSYSLLCKGTYTFDLSVAEVDQEMCVLAIPAKALSILPLRWKNMPRKILHGLRNRRGNQVGSSQGRPCGMLRMRNLRSGMSGQGHHPPPRDKIKISTPRWAF